MNRLLHKVIVPFKNLVCDNLEVMVYNEVSKENNDKKELKVEL